MLQGQHWVLGASACPLPRWHLPPGQGWGLWLVGAAALTPPSLAWVLLCSPQAEVKALKERLEIEKQAWEANYVKKEVTERPPTPGRSWARLQAPPDPWPVPLPPGGLAALAGAGAEGGGAEGAGQGDRAGHPAPGGRYVVRQGGVRAGGGEQVRGGREQEQFASAVSCPHRGHRGHLSRAGGRALAFLPHVLSPQVRAAEPISPQASGSLLGPYEQQCAWRSTAGRRGLWLGDRRSVPCTCTGEGPVRWRDRVARTGGLSLAERQSRCSSVSSQQCQLLHRPGRVCTDWCGVELVSVLEPAVPIPGWLPWVPRSPWSQGRSRLFLGSTLRLLGTACRLPAPHSHASWAAECDADISPFPPEAGEPGCSALVPSRIKRVRDKYEAELQELERSERKLQERCNELKERLAELEGENIRLQGLAKHKEQEADEIRKVGATWARLLPGPALHGAPAGPSDLCPCPR